MDSCCGHRGVLIFGGAQATTNDGAGVAHAAAWRRGLSGDESDDRLLDMLFDELSRRFLGDPGAVASAQDAVRKQTEKK